MNTKINKFIFFKITDKYYSTMKLHDMLLLYYKIVDMIYPNYIPKKLNTNNVFNRLYSQRDPPYYNCCTEHSSINNLQKYIKKNLKTDHEKKQYYRACCFFKHLQKDIIYELNFSYEWMMVRSKLNYSQEKQFLKKVKKRINKWEGIMDIITFNRKGKIMKINYDSNVGLES